MRGNSGRPTSLIDEGDYPEAVFATREEGCRELSGDCVQIDCKGWSRFVDVVPWKRWHLPVVQIHERVAQGRRRVNEDGLVRGRAKQTGLGA